MSKDPVLTIKVHRPCLKIRFHYPEAFLDFPPVLVRFDDAVYIIVKICTDRIETIIFLLILYNGLVDVAYSLFCNLAFFCGMISLYKAFWIVLVFSC